MCKFVRPAPIIKLILTNSDRQQQASLWPVATTCAAATSTTRHGVTQATRYAYAPLGRLVAKSDAVCSTHYLWDRDLMVHSRRAQDRRCTSTSRGALCHWPPFRERAKSTAPTGTNATRSCATGSPTNRAKGPGPHHGLLLSYWSWHLTVGLNILRIKADCLTFFSATRFPLQKANALLKPIQLGT